MFFKNYLREHVLPEEMNYRCQVMLLIVLSSTTPQNERKQMEGIPACLDFELKFNVGTPLRDAPLFSLITFLLHRVM